MKEIKAEMLLVKVEGTQRPPHLGTAPAILHGTLQSRNPIIKALIALRPHLSTGTVPSSISPGLDLYQEHLRAKYQSIMAVDVPLCPTTLMH